MIKVVSLESLAKFAKKFQALKNYLNAKSY